MLEKIIDKEIEQGEITVHYTLYKSKIKELNRFVYSIATTTYYKASTESYIACDVTSEEDRAVEIFEIITNSFVTSCTLKDILEDIL